MPKSCLLMGLLVCVCGVSIAGQTAEQLGLVLKGNGCHSDGYFAGKDTSSIYCDSRMEFQNKGSSPVILINPTLGYGTGLKEILYYYTDYPPPTYRPKIIGEGKIGVSRNLVAAQNFASLVDLFDGDRPPENLTITLQPGETFTFKDYVNLKVPFRTIEPERTYTEKDPETGKLIQRRMVARKVGPDCFRLVYEFSFLPYVSNPDFLEHMNQKWERYGQMPLGQNGSYSITSDQPCGLE